MKVISLAVDVRGQYVGEVGVQDDRWVSPLVITRTPHPPIVWGKSPLPQTEANGMEQGVTSVNLSNKNSLSLQDIFTTVCTNEYITG
jgi:hypothetical protein